MSRPNRQSKSYADSLSQLYSWKYGTDKRTIEVTFQVTEGCTLACKYCYQHDKSPKRMSLETGKAFIDMLFRELKDSHYAVILEFIGGEPLLEPVLISQLVDYWYYKCIMENLQWGKVSRFSICSNGTEWDKPEVQALIHKLGNALSFTVSIDGNKELHDSARVHPDGRGSYDEAIHAANDYERQYPQYKIGSKMTIAPSNIIFVYPALKHYLDSGADEIFANCVFEEGWTYEHATMLYNEMKKVADYKLENYIDAYISFFEENMFEPMDPSDNQNWCWGKGTPILTDKGYKPIEEIQIGDRVYTHDGTLKPVVNAMKHFADNVVKIKGSGLFELTCTDNHQLFAMPFDYMGNKSKKYWKPYGKYAIKDLKNKDCVQLFKMAPGNIHIEPEIAYLTGRYIGDGWDEKNHEIHSICCAFKETEELAKHFDNAGIKYNILKNKTVNQLNIWQSAPENAYLHSILKLCGHLADGKHLPENFINWDLESLQNLLQGYIDADGSYDLKKKLHKSNTVSYQLAQDLLVLLRMLDYKPTCYFNQRGGKSTIMGREVNIKDRYEIYWHDKDATFNRYLVNYDDKLFLTNLSYEPTEPQEVYNITVDENHSYIAGGLVSANCGGTGLMLACDPDGKLYPCLRYMPSSVGRDRDDYVTMGTVETGIDREKLADMQKVTRRSQSTDECFYCPIAKGCAWCSAYNWESQGSYNKRATYICPMHKARALINVYYWNKFYRIKGENKRMKNYCPKKWALQIISEEEYEMLNKLAEE